MQGAAWRNKRAGSRAGREVLAEELRDRRRNSIVRDDLDDAGSVAVVRPPDDAQVHDRVVLFVDGEILGVGVRSARAMELS